MGAPSFEFLFFGIAGAIVFHLLRGEVARQIVVLILNIAFFAMLAPSVGAILPYLLFLSVGYGAVMLMNPKSSIVAFWLAIGVVLLMFFWLKHYAFIPSATWLTYAYVTVGMSYVFFRILHLVIEARQGGLQEKPSIIAFFNYTMHFPALISGPIQFFGDFQKSFKGEGVEMDLATLGTAFWRIVLGFFKVAIVSTLLIKLQGMAIASLDPGLPAMDRAVISAFIWAIYPFFLYANFSGYTDFVVGIALLFRFRLPENFDNPFISTNFISFWARWHITLSNWLKTYVYMPLLIACMRRWPDRRAEQMFGVIAYFVTFFLVGAWHGQTTMFVFFGVLQGGGVAINKLYQNLMTDRLGRKGYKQLSTNALYTALSRGLTFTWFAFTLIWFWSDWTRLGEMLDATGLAVFGLGAIAVWLSMTVLLWLLDVVTRTGVSGLLGSRYARTCFSTAMALVLLFYQVIISGPAPDLVYKNF